MFILNSPDLSDTSLQIYCSILVFWFYYYYTIYLLLKWKPKLCSLLRSYGIKVLMLWEKYFNFGLIFIRQISLFTRMHCWWKYKLLLSFQNTVKNESIKTAVSSHHQTPVPNRLRRSRPPGELSSMQYSHRQPWATSAYAPGQTNPHQGKKEKNKLNNKQ
jgi:hypothetical protein